MARALDYFTPQQIERARGYHRPLYWLFPLDLALGFAVLGLLAFGPPGDWIDRLLEGLPWWAESPAWSSIVGAIGWLVGLPIAYRRRVQEVHWGFSTQTTVAWLLDRLKGLAVALILTSLTMLGLIAAARWQPDAWPAVAAPGAAAVVLFLSFIGPVVLEPIFNRFRPLDDRALVQDIRTLADRAGVPIRDVLVADASRRTTKENAYVSGLGKTRRVVVFDTLLRRADPAQVRLIGAHELGHRRMRHVAGWTGIGMAGAAGTVLVLWALLQLRPILRAIGASGASDPRIVPFALLIAGALQLVGMPVAAALSRRWESAADRFALELTEDPATFDRSFHDLAVSNLSDLDPPRLFYLVAFTHPTPAERIAAGRSWAAARGSLTSPNRSTTAS